MPLEFRRQRDGRLRDIWFGAFEINGKRYGINLGVKIAGTPPASLSLRDKGDTEYEVSRTAALAKLEHFIEDARKKNHTEHLVEKHYEIKTGESITSLVPPLGSDKSKVLTLNLRNRMIFRSADEADAVQAADFLGKKRVVKRSWGSSAGKHSVNYSETEEYKIKPHKLRSLRDHECVLVHCEKGFQRLTLPPLEPDGLVASWFPFQSRLR